MSIRDTIHRSWKLLAALAAVLVAAALWWYSQRPAPVTIGVEGRYTLVAASPNLTAVPYTHGDALAVRIAGSQRIGDQTRYDLRYMAFGPGEQDLARYLLDAHGKPIELPGLIVSVDALLPDDYSGILYDTPATPINLHSRYRLLMGMLWGLWGLSLIPLALMGRKHRVKRVQAAPPPSIAERLRQLLQTAEHQGLSVEEQADLEKLLLAYWAERLKIPAQRLADTLEELRHHPEAAGQVQSVERWLHGKQTPVNGEIARQLLGELGWGGNQETRR